MIRFAVKKGTMFLTSTNHRLFGRMYGAIDECILYETAEEAKLYRVKGDNPKVAKISLYERK